MPLCRYEHDLSMTLADSVRQRRILGGWACRECGHVTPSFPGARGHVYFKHVRNGVPPPHKPEKAQRKGLMEKGVQVLEIGAGLGNLWQALKSPEGQAALEALGSLEKKDGQEPRQGKIGL